jgi:hypothetical protein
MKRLVLCFWLILVPASGPAQTLRTEPKLQKLIEDIRADVNPREAMDLMLQANATDRWFMFPKFQETAEYLRGAMKSIGLGRVELADTPGEFLARQE